MTAKARFHEWLEEKGGRMLVQRTMDASHTLTWYSWSGGVVILHQHGEMDFSVYAECPFIQIPKVLEWLEGQDYSARVLEAQAQVAYLKANHEEIAREAAFAKALTVEMMDKLDKVSTTIANERDTMREVLERMAEDCWNGNNIDGGFFQDLMVEKGLMVEVPAPPEWSEEWDSDTMYQLAWKVVDPNGP